MEYYKLNSNFYLIDTKSEEEKTAILKMGGIDIEAEALFLMKSAVFEKNILQKEAAEYDDDLDEATKKEIDDIMATKEFADRNTFLSFLNDKNIFLIKTPDGYNKYTVSLINDDQIKKIKDGKIKVDKNISDIYTNVNIDNLNINKEDYDSYVILNKITSRNQKSQSDKLVISIADFKEHLISDPELISKFITESNGKNWEKEKNRLENDRLEKERDREIQKVFDTEKSDYNINFDEYGEDEELTPEERRIVDEGIKQRQLKFNANNPKNNPLAEPKEEELKALEQAEQAEQVENFRKWRRQKNQATASNEFVNEILKNAALAEIYIKIANRNDVNNKNLDSIIEEEILNYLIIKSAGFSKEMQNYVQTSILNKLFNIIKSSSNEEDFLKNIQATNLADELDPAEVQRLFIEDAISSGKSRSWGIQAYRQWPKIQLINFPRIESLIMSNIEKAGYPQTSSRVFNKLKNDIKTKFS